MSNREIYTNHLTNLTNIGSEAILIGSFANLLHGEESHYKDVDIIIPFTEKYLTIIEEYFLQEEFSLFIWGEPITKLTKKGVEGRYYVRALKDDLQFDINIGPLPLSYQQLRNSAQKRGAIMIASLKDLGYLKRAKRIK